MLIMVRIEFLGAWKDEDVQAVRDVTVTGIEKNLKISILPAYFEEEYSSVTLDAPPQERRSYAEER
jgi:hypothetical protein